MALHLVGKTIDKVQSHYRAETGKLVQLMRGIYVDAGDDVDSTVLKHAIRIAKYLYPRAYLSAASAILLAPTRDGRLFLSGRRIQRTRIRALEIIQNEAPKHPSLGSAVIDDGLGEFRTDVSSIRQRLLEAFRLRSEHAASIDEGMREAIAARLIEEFGSANAAADAVWRLARENEWYREGEHAERFLLRYPAAAPVHNEAALHLIVAWHGTPIGNLVHDGFEWRWQPIEGSEPTLVRQTTPGKLPPLIVSLLPEGWLEKILKNPDERAVLRSGKRYMSNITIVERQSELADLPPDILLTHLDQYSKNGVFTGTYTGPRQGDLEESFERNLAQIYERATTPRISGIQIKAPMYLDADGRLSPSVGNPFTHILKPVGTSGFGALPLVEWTCLELGRAVGFQVPATALVNIEGISPALLVERFDIRLTSADQRKLALEDMCSVLNLPPEAKYDATIEQIARAVRPISTQPEEDLKTIYKRALFAWFVADGDMHLKNIALLKIAQPGDTHFRSIAIAPLYDAVTTRIFPGLKHDRMALKLNGKDDRLRRSDFEALSRTMGLLGGFADAATEEMIERLKGAVEHLVLPTLPSYGDNGRAMVELALASCRERLAKFS
jgi:serine/threonine-protein kinase HipA